MATNQASGQHKKGYVLQQCIRTDKTSEKFTTYIKYVIKTTFPLLEKQGSALQFEWKLERLINF